MGKPKYVQNIVYGSILAITFSVVPILICWELENAEFNQRNVGSIVLRLLLFWPNYLV